MQLCYFKNVMDLKPRGLIPLLNAMVSDIGKIKVSFSEVHNSFKREEIFHLPSMFHLHMVKLCISALIKWRVP